MEPQQESTVVLFVILDLTRMWANGQRWDVLRTAISGYFTLLLYNAQRDGRPAEYRWRPLFNAAKFGWRPLLECRAVTLTRRETRWNLQGCPKLRNLYSR